MIRDAKYMDAESIQNLIRIFAEDGKVLFRSLDNIRENIADFWVYEKNGLIVGVCSLKTGWDRLVELRSLGVDPRFAGQGIGTALVRAGIEKALMVNCDSLFVFTYAVSLFERLGFQWVDKETLPLKVWNDCAGCLHQHNCDETAMILSLVSIRSGAHAELPTMVKAV